MANLATAPQRAMAVKGPKSAARLYYDIDYELALGELAGDEENAGEEALHTLERRFPGVREQAHSIEDGPPNLSRGAKDNLHGGRRRRASSRPGRTSTTTRAPRPTRPTPPPGPAPSRTSRILDADLPSLPSIGGGQLLVQVITWGMGLSLLYLFLTHSKSADSLASGLASTTRALVSTSIDPLNPHPVVVRKPTVTAARPTTRATAGLPASGFSHTLAVQALAAKKAQ